MDDIKIFFIRKNEFLKNVCALENFLEGNSFKSQKRIEQFCLGRFLINYVLKNYYNIKHPEIVIKNKKPCLKNEKIYFSLSHSNDIILAAFFDKNIGVDIEWMRDRDFQKLFEYYRINSENKDKETFYQLWTVYEAEIKLQPDQINLTVKQQIDTKVDNLQIGGRNLIIKKDAYLNKYLDVSGNLAENSTTDTMKEYIKVEPGEVLTFQKENSDEYFGGVVYVSLAYEPAVGGEYRGERAVLVLIFDAGDFVGVNPAVARNNAFFFVFFEINFVRHDFILSEGRNNCK